MLPNPRFSLFFPSSHFPFSLLALHRAPALSPAVSSRRTRNGPPPLCRHKPSRPFLLPPHPTGRPPGTPLLGQHPHPSKLCQHSRTHRRPQRRRRPPTRPSVHKGRSWRHPAPGDRMVGGPCAQLAQGCHAGRQVFHGVPDGMVRGNEESGPLLLDGRQGWRQPASRCLAF